MDELVSTVDVIASTDLVSRSGGDGKGSFDGAWVVDLKTWIVLELVGREVIDPHARSPCHLHHRFVATNLRLNFLCARLQWPHLCLSRCPCTQPHPFGLRWIGKERVETLTPNGMVKWRWPMDFNQSGWTIHGNQEKKKHAEHGNREKKLHAGGLSCNF